MNKLISILILVFCLTNCESPKQVSLEVLNGYWEIEKAIAPNGEEKPYLFNSFIDFIAVKKDSTGYRAKLKPNFRGTYEGNSIKQFFKINHQNNNYIINYNVGNTSWSETLIEATPNKFVTRNNEGVLYIYKTFSPITVE